MWLLMLHPTDIQAHWCDACSVEAKPTKSVRPQYTHAGIRSRALSTSDAFAKTVKICDDNFYIRLHTDNTRFSIALAKLASAKKEKRVKEIENVYGEVIPGSVLVLFVHWIDDPAIEKWFPWNIHCFAISCFEWIVRCTDCDTRKNRNKSIAFVLFIDFFYCCWNENENRKCACSEFSGAGRLIYSCGERGMCN